jgi:hypothetical protein
MNPDIIPGGYEWDDYCPYFGRSRRYHGRRKSRPIGYAPLPSKGGQSEPTKHGLVLGGVAHRNSMRVGPGHSAGRADKRAANRKRRKAKKAQRRGK